MNVPFLDLKVQYQQIKDEILPILQDIMGNAMFIGGPHVTGLEEEFADFCDTGFCAGVASGTDAIRFALTAAGVGAGDEVITVPNTFIATSEAITQAGAKIAFVDVDPNTSNMDPNQLEDYLKKRLAHAPSGSAPRPKAVIPVHLYGQPADMASITAIACRYGLAVIEDACQAHGALFDGKKAGSMGVAGCFSFYPGKNLGAFGEAGAVVSNDEQLIKKIKTIRDHGQAAKYFHDMEGYNGRLDAIQAAVLRSKLKRLAQWNQARRKNAALYDSLLADIPGISRPVEAARRTSVYHLYVIHAQDRDALMKHLNQKNIGTGLHYPLPLHLQKAYQHLGYKKGDFPVAEERAGKLLSLPMFAELTEAQIHYVASAVREYNG